MKVIRYVVLVAAGTCMSTLAVAQDPFESYEDQPLNMELQFSIGYARSLEQNFFNDNTSIQPRGGISFLLGGRYYPNYSWSFGVHLMGHIDMIRDFDGLAVLGFDYDNGLQLSNMLLGSHMRYILNYDPIQPYIQVGVSYSFGALTLIEFEEDYNTFSGVSFQLGTGIGYMVRYDVMLSLSVMRNGGWAKWKNPISISAVNDRFNNGFWAISIGASVFMNHND